MRSVNMKKELQNLQMQDTDCEEFEVTEGGYGKVLQIFSTKKTNAYKFSF